MGKVVLEIKDLNLYYGRIHALKGISLKVSEGEIITLIGANGAGKTSTLRAISSLEKIKSGEVYFYGEKINGVSANKLVSKSLVHI